MPAVSPLIRLSIGLILLTVSLLLVSDLLGLAPNQMQAEITARKSIAESLAVQVSNDVSDGRLGNVAETMKTLQTRNDSVLSVGLRSADGRLISTAGDHVKHWIPPDDEKSTATHVQVQIHSDSGRWGVLEVSFKPLDGLISSLFSGGSIAAMIGFIAISGFLAYWLFLKRALNELDPSAVVPDRVRAALDVLAEGLVILDRSGRIVLANDAFERLIGQASNHLVGIQLSALGWVSPEDDDGDTLAMPWKVMLDGGEQPDSMQLRLRTAQKELLLFAVNVAPIKAPDGTIRGAVVTFDNITELQRKNTDLEYAMDRLKQSQREITRQNRELQVLATRDPLTDSLNRRSLFEGMETLLREAAETAEPLSCIMVDIDHFKSINDRFGHATGDKVIKLLARILAATARTEDLVGRYGGEEFCVALPGVDEHQAAEVAERMRVAVHDGKNAKFTSAIRISASFGVSTDTEGKMTPGALIDLADKALYVAKQSGRNRVVRWSEVPEQPEDAEGNTQPAAQSTAQSSEQASEQSAQGEGDARLHQRIAELEALVQEQNIQALEPTDETTGLPSRVVLVDRIKQAVVRSQRFGTRLAVLSIDIDTLQVIRSTMGESAAEKLMKLVAGRLKGTLRSTDTIAVHEGEEIGVSISRVGGGEFAVLLTDMEESESTTWVIQRMFATLKDALQIEGNEVVVDARIGVSLYPADGDDPDVLLANAGVALRGAKLESGKNVCLFYSKELNQRSKEQLRMEGQLHRAVERDELFLEYQPVVDMLSGRIAAFEALLRWRHPEWGMVPPDRFIPMAEHSGLIDEIGDWVLEHACQQLKSWHDAGYEQLSMAINFSAVQFRKPGLAERVMEIVEQVGVPPNLLTAEITESALIQNLDTAVAIVDGLNHAGVRVALDDFGTGYSSLSYLKRFPIDVVKIDRSFLRDFPLHAHDTAIVSAIIGMAHGLGLRVVAEGVETDNQLQVLQSLRCDEIQGYLFSRPISREQATSLLGKPSDIRRTVRAAGELGLAGNLAADSAIAGVLNEAPQRKVAI